MRYLITILMVFAITQLYSQTTITFGYDNSGNRTSGNVIFLKSSQSDEENKSSTLIDNLTSSAIKIYPNPTKGMLQVEISNAADLSPALSVYSLDGKLLLKTVMSGDLQTIDLSSFNNGMYILRIQIGKENSTWKIIKE